MAAQLEVTVDSTDQKLGYTGSLRSLPPIAMDYIPPAGSGQGYLPLEMVLMSLAACSGGTVGYLIRKKGKAVSNISVTAKGIRREQHPLSFEKISLEFVIRSIDTKDEDVQKALELAEKSVCPVWALLKGNVEICAGYTIVGP